jgi:hypothetical protein
MMPVIYTTYGVAMGHRPETLAASGGLRPAGARRTRERPALVAISRAPCWLEGLLVRIGLRHREVAGPAADTGETVQRSERLLCPTVATATIAFTGAAPTTAGGDHA